MTGPIERLEKELDRAIEAGDESLARDLEDELRDMYRDEAERENWENEGRERGWW